jgi:glycosyltransferase involved in cell wall biosynthesis
MNALQQFPSIGVIIPTLNEAQNLSHVLPYIPSTVSQVILVDGHSTDDTQAVARQLLPTIHVIEQEGFGKGDALRTGFNACQCDIIVMLDADGSTDPREIPHFVQALTEGYDFAKGSRFLNGAASYDISLLRRLGNCGLCQLVNLLFGTHFSDLCYGYIAFWRRCLDQVSIDCNGFEIETLISLRVYKSYLKIIEVPSFEYPRVWGKSNLHPFRDGWRVLQTIVAERLRKTSSSPLIYASAPCKIVEQSPMTEEAVM